MCDRRLLATVLIGFVVSGLAGCAGPETKGDEPTTESETRQAGAGEADFETEWDGHDRLAETVRPEAYELDLAIDPARETIRGKTAVEVIVEEPTERIRMHAEKLEFSKVRASRDGSARKVRAKSVEHGGLVLAFEETLEPGSVRLEFAYEAPLGQVPEGLYRVESGGAWYAYSQFQPLEARTAFPSFDEPGFKAPFEVTLRIPEGMTAATATPVVDRQSGEREGTEVWKFAETKPLPTYLIAFAVGEFDVVEAPSEAMDGVALRVLTVQGKGDLAEYALETTPPLVEYQTEYFGQAFPYEKLDLVAVPNFGAAAMENVGLVTYRESLLLLDPDQASAGDRYWAAAVMAHEYAHMWFGNMVTLEWWDDIWLNEAFATWMGTKTLRNVLPEFEASIDAVDRALGVMEEDALASARAIRQPIEDGGDVYDAFDGITYQKGRAVLDMIEQWLGEDQFRAGVRSYLEANAHGTATTEKLLASLGEAAGEPVREVSRQFLDQPGVPLVTLAYDQQACRESGTARLELEQTRYLPAGSEAEVGEPWTIPTCVRLGDGDGETETRCFLFESGGEAPRRQRVELETDALQMDGCPSWVHPNADESGYYRWKLEPIGENAKLLEHLEAMTLRERVALLPQLEALVRRGDLEVATYLQAVEQMAAEQDHRLVVEHVVSTLRTYLELVYEGKPTEAFTEFASGLIGPHYERVGHEPEPGESKGVRLLRPTVVRAAADLAENEEVVEWAINEVARFLEEPSSETGPTIKFALDIAARHDGEKLWTRLRENLDRAPNPSMRAEMISALGQFRQPELARRSLDLFLSDAVRAQNFWRLMGPISGTPATRSVGWEWLTEHYEGIADKIGKARAGRLPGVGSGFCSEEARRKVEAFFAQEAHRTMTTPRNLEQTLEAIDLCVAHRKLVEEGVREYIEGGS